MNTEKSSVLAEQPLADGLSLMQIIVHNNQNVPFVHHGSVG